MLTRESTISTDTIKKKNRSRTIWKPAGTDSSHDFWLQHLAKILQKKTWINTPSRFNGGILLQALATFQELYTTINHVSLAITLFVVSTHNIIIFILVLFLSCAKVCSQQTIFIPPRDVVMRLLSHASELGLVHLRRTAWTDFRQPIQIEKKSRRVEINYFV